MFEFSARKVGPSGMNLGQRCSRSRRFQLAGDGEEGFAAEVLREVDLAGPVRGRLARSRRRDAEHLAGAFGVRAVMIGVLTQTKPSLLK